MAFASVMLAVMIIVFYVIIMHCIGYDIRIIYSNKGIGIPSNDGKYQLVETSDRTGQYLLFSIIQLKKYDSDNNADYSDCPQTLFVADDFWYHNRWVSDYGWIEGTNDFYINSSDSGMHRYFFNGDTWVPEY